MLDFSTIPHDTSDSCGIYIDNPLAILGDLRKRNINKIIFGHININHLAGKFEDLSYLIKDKLDVLVVTETKLDDSFPSSQFTIEGFLPPYRLDRNINGGGILIYVSELIPCNQVKLLAKSNDVESILIEINLRNTKWLLLGGYNPSQHSISHFLNYVSRNLDKCIPNYDNLILLGDFNSTIDKKQMKDFCQQFNLINLIKEPTCFKNPENPSCIDLILTNRKDCFCNSIAFETGLSDHHKMVVTELKVYIKKIKPIVIKYRAYKSFCLNTFT